MSSDLEEYLRVKDPGKAELVPSKKEQVREQVSLTRPTGNAPRKGAKCAGKILTRRRGERGGQAVPSSYALCLKSYYSDENISAPSASPREE